MTTRVEISVSSDQPHDVEVMKVAVDECGFPGSILGPALSLPRGSSATFCVWQNEAMYVREKT